MVTHNNLEIHSTSRFSKIKRGGMGWGERERVASNSKWSSKHSKSTSNRRFNKLSTDLTILIPLYYLVYVTNGVLPQIQITACAQRWHERRKKKTVKWTTRKLAFQNPKKRFKLYKNIWITFSRTLRKHIIGGAAGSHPKDMLLSHLQNKFVNIITQKMSTLQQIRISNKIWQINQD